MQKRVEILHIVTCFYTLFLLFDETCTELFFV
nr:MAG TPA: hypothetical protein [Caudoviricetes sp.]